MLNIYARFLASLRKTAWLLVFGVYVFASGCNGSETTWSAEVRSPDGKIIATGRTIEDSGLGTGGGGTTVYLNWTTGSQPPTEILALDVAPRGPGDTVVQMMWVTPRHLELTYKGTSQDVGFEAIKWADVEISVRATSGGASKPSR